MENINRSALVGYSSKQMFKLVDDVAKYPEFVPFCTDAQIIERTENSVSATLLIAKGGIAKSFSTRNTLNPYESIQMQLLNGPFKQLSGEWRFKSLSDSACKIELHLDYEFSNKLASLAFSTIFEQLTQSMVTAFTDRAAEIYG